MPGKKCYHCREWVEDPKTHNCWTTTPEKLTEELSEDLKEAWERLRETALGFGEQRSYASHKSIMFSRKSCYFFVRPKRAFLEVCFFLLREVKDPMIKKAELASKTKWFHVVSIIHRDQVEPPLTDWLSEAYEVSGMKPAVTPKKKKPLTKAKRKKPPPT